jgi:predicted  nucleic acid-binding Zn-ribbon protein
MNLTIKEIIDNAIDELQRARESIGYLHECVGEPIGDGPAITDDEMLIDDINKSIERLATIVENEETENYRKFKKALANTISVEALEEYILGNPDDLMRMNVEDVFKKITTSKRCPKCGKILYLSDLPQYDYVCTECDENFYECEVK